ncbi:hypothetical protein PKOR_20495 [Pontibacter korlensis]|uniref:Uncharacterized protein n=2 Tax=Pontibacter korlensis TaxID=400092 RepID=A0A0E3ZID4_9BACT|nr:hypothetical protein PKOR_20495 [Pontibacter korlensis]
MTPEVAILAMHEHEHTEDVITSEVTVGKAHLHCDIDKHFDSSYLLSHFSYEIALAPQQGLYVQPYSFAWKFTFPNNTFLRGPPLA